MSGFGFHRRQLWLALAAAALMTAPALAQEKTALALPSITPSYAAVYVAQDRGFWKKEGLDVTVSQVNGVGTFNAVVAGSVDFGGSNAGTLLRAAVAGQRMLAIANFTNSFSNDLVLRKDVAERVGFDAKAPLEKRLSLLKGLKIGIDAINSINHAFLRYAATRGGLNAETDLTVAPLQAPTMAAAMSAKAIDGFTVAEPWTTAVIFDGTAVALASVPGGDFPELTPWGGGVIVTRPAFCQEKPSICTKMGHGLANAVLFIRDHPADALAVLKPYFGQVPEPVLADAFRAYGNSAVIPPAINEATLRNSEDFQVKGGITKVSEKLTSFDDLFTDKFVR
jgi:ABC-type nitrate/sulfonate/bicarbonate transport system substrate-binding protein